MHLQWSGQSLVPDPGACQPARSQVTSDISGLWRVKWFCHCSPWEGDGGGSLLFQLTAWILVTQGWQLPAEGRGYTSGV